MICHCGNTVETFREIELNSRICGMCANARKRDISKKRGNMIFDHKTAPYIQIVSAEAQKQFYKDTYRKGT